MAEVPTAPVSAVGQVLEGPQWWNSLEHETTPELRWPLSIYVYDRMRSQDAQVISVLRAVTLPIMRTQWRIDPNGARPEVYNLVAEDLGLPVVGRKPGPLPRSRDRFSWKEHLRLALLCLPFGHAFFEQLYRIDGDMVHLRKLEERPQMTIETVNVASDGGLISIQQWGVDTPIGVDRLVAYTNEREAGNWLGRSLLRSAYKNWLLKDRLLRTQAQTVDRNGMGVPTYIGAEGEKSLSAGQKIARSIRSGDNSGAAIPNGAELKLLGVEGDLPDADVPIRYHDEQIARAVLAHFLNLGTQTGSWALGTTFADFFTLSLQSAAQTVQDVANMHIVEDLVDVNWGTSEPAPRIVFDEIGSNHQATADAIKLLIDSKAITVDEATEDHLRNTYGLPARTKPRPEPQEPSSSPSAPAAPPPGPEGGAPPAAPGPAPVAAAVRGPRPLAAAATPSPVDTTYPKIREQHQRTAEVSLAAFFEQSRSSGSIDEAELADILFTLSKGVAYDIATRATHDAGGTVQAAVLDLSVMDNWLLTAAATSARSIAAAISVQLDEAESLEDLPEDETPTDHVFDILTTAKAAEYASGLVSQMSTFAAHEAGTVAGLTHKRWKVNSANPRKAHKRLDGETVPLGENFSNGMSGPGAGGGPEDTNCKCSIELVTAP